MRRIAWILIGASTAAAIGCAWIPDETSARGDLQDYLFCFWNVENLFDDREDGRTHSADREFDRWFARDSSALHLKLSRLSEALVAMNGGRGPDIFAAAEVESTRAAHLLQEALNDRLPAGVPPYRNVLMKEVAGGRHIAPMVITRLAVRADRTRLHGNRQRILEAHVTAGGHDLVILASHWTSRLTDKNGRHRADYGDKIYGVFRAMYQGNRAVDLLVCGDFNDPPDAASVTSHLRAIGDQEEVRSGRVPLLLDLFAGKDPNRFGTHYYGRKWFIFDQIAVSPGLLDGVGWECDVDSVRTVNTLVRPGDRFRRPWRFGSERDEFTRGYSDHFPVVVRLRVRSET